MRLVLLSAMLGLFASALSVILCAVSPWSVGIRARPPTPGKHWHWFETGLAILYTERGVAA